MANSKSKRPNNKRTQGGITQNRGPATPEEPEVSSATTPKMTPPPPLKPVSTFTQTRTSGSTAVQRRPLTPPPLAPKKGLSLPLIAGIVAVLTGLAILGILFFGKGADTPTPSPASTAEAATAAPNAAAIAVGPDAAAKIETFANQGQQHINQGESHLPYNSDPPTSGPHYSSPLPWGIYNAQQPDEFTVHNLEHGGVVIAYVCPANNCTNVVNSLSAYAQRYPKEAFSGILLQPRASLPEGAKIALTAWTHRLLLKSLDTQKINEFIGAYFDKAPESATRG